jgi:hypothetical protein
MTTLMLLACVVAASGCNSSNKGGPTGDAGHDAAVSGSDAGDASVPQDASDAATNDASGDGALEASVEAPPPFDAGAGCVAPTNETPLSPAAEGVPAEGLVLWLRADRGVYKFVTPASAAAGTTTTVCAWADQSGHQFILTAAGERPTWQMQGFNDEDVIGFPAAGQQLSIGSVLGLAPTSARTIVSVQLAGGAQRFEPLLQGQSGTPGTYLGLDQNTFNTVGNREGVYMMNNAYDATLATSTAPRIHVYTIQTMTPGTPILGNIDYRINGVAQTLTRNNGGLGNGNFEDFSGANFTSVGTLGGGQIAQVLIYNRALTIEERAALETRLEADYGINPGN